MFSAEKREEKKAYVKNILYNSKRIYYESLFMKFKLCSVQFKNAFLNPLIAKMTRMSWQISFFILVQTPIQEHRDPYIRERPSMNK